MLRTSVCRQRRCAADRHILAASAAINCRHPPLPSSPPTAHRHRHRHPPPTRATVIRRPTLPPPSPTAANAAQRCHRRRRRRSGLQGPCLAPGKPGLAMTSAAAPPRPGGPVTFRTSGMWGGAGGEVPATLVELICEM